jgi:hypothetical protein
MLRTSLASLFAAGVLASPALAVPLLSNGSFESGLAGWNPAGVVQVHGAQGESDGTLAAAFNGGNQAPNGVVSNSFTTFAGQKYFVEFDFRRFGSSANGTSGLRSAAIDANSSTTLNSIDVFDATGDGATGLTQNYVTSDYSFVAQGNPTQLRFTDISGGTTNHDAMLDRVGVNIIRNGSFEQGLAGWNLTGNAGVSGIANGFDEGESNGLDGLGFNGGQQPPNAVLTQTFDTLVGGVYTVEFDFRKWSGATTPGTARLDFSVFDTLDNDLLGSLVAVDTVGDTGKGQIFGPPWIHHSLTFVATSTKTTLSFRDTSIGTNNFDPRLDNVNVTISNVIPEPAAAVLALAGIAGLALRRRSA